MRVMSTGATVQHRRGQCVGVAMTALMAAAVMSVAVVGCVGPGLYTQADVVRSDIDKARKSGAYQCAPRELALAESNVDFAQNELAQGDFLRAQAHMDVAVQNAQLALQNSKECAPKRVLIKQNTDRDGDGIFDDLDACPDQAEDKDLFEDEDGCPEADNDKDGVLDALDRCPNTAGPAENAGCPFDDRDADGVPDPKDACPDAAEDKDGDRDDDGRPDLDADNDGVQDCVAGCAPPAGTTCDSCTQGTPQTTLEDKDGFEDDDGCPDVDNDKDGLLDTLDACPNVPGPPETKGCPDQDGDSIADIDDKCPTQPGVLQPDVPEKNGCPKEYKLIIIKNDRIEIKQQVQFDTGKATIKPISAKLLAEVGDALRNSNLEKVTVEGHTDDVGDDASNLRLSQDRATSVLAWLRDIEHVKPELMEAIGYGETKPFVSNRTKSGRQQNRRVEFKVQR